MPACYSAAHITLLACESVSNSPASLRRSSAPAAAAVQPGWPVRARLERLVMWDRGQALVARCCAASGSGRRPSRRLCSNRSFATDNLGTTKAELTVVGLELASRRVYRSLNGVCIAFSTGCCLTLISITRERRLLLGSIQTWDMSACGREALQLR